MYTRSHTHTNTESDTHTHARTHAHTHNNNVVYLNKNLIKSFKNNKREIFFLRLPIFDFFIGCVGYIVSTLTLQRVLMIGLHL